MTSRILMATVAAIALAGPAGAEDQADPLKTGQDVPQQAQEPLQNKTVPAMPADQPAEAELPRVTAPTTADEQRPEAPADVTAEEETAPPAEMQFIAVQDEAQFLADDELIGEEVINGADEEVGEIADLIIDQDQKLVGVVLSVGGFLGLGEKWVGVPVDTVQFPSGDQPARLLVAVTKEQLENAPDFMTRDAVEAQVMLQDAENPAPATTSQ
jgi:hypothetical protein